MNEKLLLPKVTLGIIIGLGLVACGEDSSTPADPTVQTEEGNDTSRTVEYFNDGTRIIRFNGTLENLDGDNQFPADILQFCDGTDLVEQSLGVRGYPAGDINRTTTHSACADGMLTEPDFN